MTPTQVKCTQFLIHPSPAVGADLRSFRMFALSQTTQLRTPPSRRYPPSEAILVMDRVVESCTHPLSAVLSYTLDHASMSLTPRGQRGLRVEKVE